MNSLGPPTEMVLYQSHDLLLLVICRECHIKLSLSNFIELNLSVNRAAKRPLLSGYLHYMNLLQFRNNAAVR